MSLFFQFLVLLAPKQFISFRFQFNLSYLNILYIFTIFRDFSKISLSSSHYTRRLEIRKIFRLYQNLTKFDRVARFHETNLTAQSVSSSEI